MADNAAQEVWSGILSVLENTLQFGVLNQAKSVVDVRLQGGSLILSVSSEEAFDFFSREINQQRLRIVSRSFANLESIQVERVAAEPLR